MQPEAPFLPIESKLIDYIRDWLSEVSPPYPLGMGDDCAVLPASSYQHIITTDSLSYGQHIDETVSPKDAGAKLIKRNLSDIAAMGGTADHAVLALLCGPDVSIDWLQEFFGGIRETCQTYSLKLVGGDISALPPGQFSSVLTLVGHSPHPKLRKSARIGDLLYVKRNARRQHPQKTLRLYATHGGRTLAREPIKLHRFDGLNRRTRQRPARSPAG